MTLKGVIVNSQNAHIEDVMGVGATWIHDGGPRPPVYSGIESIPGIQWGQEHDAGGGNSRWLFTWNELNHTSITPDEAAIRWRKVIEPLYRSKLLLAPGCSWRNNHWVEEWLDCYRTRYNRRPQFYAVNVHGYSGSWRDVIPEFQAALAFATANYRKLWVCEYAALPDPGWTETEMLSEAWRVIGWAMLHNVERFAWFNTRTRGDEKWAMDYNAPLFDYDSGAMTASGELYRAWRGQ